MQNFFSGSIRKNLIILVLCSVLPALGIILYSGLKMREQALDDAKRDAIAAVEAMGDAQEKITSAASQLLGLLARMPAVRALDRKKTSELLATLLKANPVYANLLLIDLQGETIASGLPSSTANFADRKHFRDALQNKGFAPGGYVRGRMSNEQVFPFGQAVLDDQGNPVAVLMLGVKLDTFPKLFDLDRFPQGTMVGLVDYQGVRLLIHPASPETNPVGKQIKADVWAEVSGQGGSGITIKQGSDGFNRYYAYKKLRLRPEDDPYLYLVVGIPAAQATARADSLMRQNLLLLSLAALFALALARVMGELIIGRKVSRLQTVAERLGRGDLAARSEMEKDDCEFGRIGQAMDAMAEALRRDEARRKRLEEELTRLASTDSLTGTANRRQFLLRAEAEVARSTRYGEALALLMLDVDDFKAINDTHGHAVGDEVLKALVLTSQNALRTPDVFGRIGGEEFAALLVHTGPEDAKRIAERLRTALAGLQTPVGTVIVRFTVSIGLAVFAPGDSVDDLFKRADDALYSAKRSGRNRVVTG